MWHQVCPHDWECFSILWFWSHFKHLPIIIWIREFQDSRRIKSQIRHGGIFVYISNLSIFPPQLMVPGNLDRAKAVGPFWRKQRKRGKMTKIRVLFKIVINIYIYIYTVSSFHEQYLNIWIVLGYLDNHFLSEYIHGFKIWTHDSDMWPVWLQDQCTMG